MAHTPSSEIVTPDPFDVLGLDPNASLADIRAARRRLAKERHPDHGGDEAAMQQLNVAFDAALKHVLRPSTPPLGPATSAPSPRARSRVATTRQRRHLEHDHPSFTIDALPGDAFELLVVATNWFGEVLVDDPPWLLELHLFDPAPCWCRLMLVSDAGSSTISLSVAPESPGHPSVEVVRDQYIHIINELLVAER